MTVPDKGLDFESVSLLYYKKHAILRGCDSQSNGMPSCLTNRLNKRRLFRHEDC